MSFSALILAGGQSRRMGQDKAELRLGKLSLLQHMQQLAQQAGASQILLSRNQPGTTYIQDLRPGLGPLAGIAAGLVRDNVPTARGGVTWYASTVRAVLNSAELDAAAA